MVSRLLDETRERRNRLLSFKPALEARVAMHDGSPSMHELPEALANSLRAWRGSLHSASNEPLDLEQGGDECGEKEREGAQCPDDDIHQVIVSAPPDNHPARRVPWLKRTLQSRRHSSHALRSDAGWHPSLPGYRAHTSPHDPGKEPALQPHRHPHASKPPSPHHPPAPKLTEPDPAAPRLASEESQPLPAPAIYNLLGLRPSTTPSPPPSALALPAGLYSQILAALATTQSRYRLYNLLTYALLILQLLLSAVFIVLGSLPPARDSRLAIAVLGAISTVVSSALALMKGQGLPHRLRRTRDALRKVVFEAEELFWDVRAERAVYFRDVVRLREDFWRAVEEAGRGRPEVWDGGVVGVAEGMGLPGRGGRMGYARNAVRETRRSRKR